MLKSLAVFDHAGGRIISLDYQTPTADRYPENSIRLGDLASLRDLLISLRGRDVGLRMGDHIHHGRMVGLDEMPNDAAQDYKVVLLTDSGATQIFALSAVEGVTLRDEIAARDLSFFLDGSVFRDKRMALNIRLSEGDHDLRLQYVAPAPVWRVSYRVVGESESGKALLQAWGLFDNHLEEDLEAVKVTLVAGQPISFIYQLDNAVIPARPVVADEARVAPGPIEFEGARMALDEAPSGGGVAYMRGGVEPVPAPAPMMAKSIRSATIPPTVEQYADSFEAATEGKEAGEFFQYAMTTPISVKRGESALVPILSQDIRYERELLYNRAKLPDHPVAALRFMNESALTLERGPVTLVEDGDYKGEAIIPFTKAGREIYLPYAVELGVKITERTEHTTQTVGLHFRDEYAVFDEYHITQIHYALENVTDKPQAITLEAAIISGTELFETPAPIVESATEQRWRVDVPALSKTTFTRKHRIRTSRQQIIQGLDAAQLRDFLDHRWLDQETFRRLEDMNRKLDEIRQLQAKLSAIGGVRTGLYEQQGQLRENLKSLGAGGDEAALRKRMLDRLATTQDQLDALEQQETALNEAIKAGEEAVKVILASLGDSSAN